MGIFKVMRRAVNGSLWRLARLVLVAGAGVLCSCNVAPQGPRVPGSVPKASSDDISARTEKTNKADETDKNTQAMEDMARTDQIALLELCLARCQSQYKDYICDFMKQERIAGQLSKEQDIQVKFMQSPFSVSMFWTRNSPSGDRLLYVEGKWGNQVLVRPAGVMAVIGTVKRPPAGPQTMAAALHPVTDFGFERALTSLLSVYTQAKEAGDLRQEFGGYAQVGGRKTIVLARYVPGEKYHSADKNLTYIDLEYQVPTLIEGFDHQNQLSYRYLYTDIHFNVGLTARDFVPEANDMRNPG
jgi:hypothetical protein